MATSASTDPAPGAYGPILPSHIVMLMILATVWGSSFMVSKIGVQHMSPMQLTALRLVVAAAAMVLVTVVTRVGIPRGAKLWVFCFVLAFFGNSLPFFLISWGVEAIPSGLAAILMAVMPLTTLVLAHFFTPGDRLKTAKLVGVLFGFAGVIVLVGPDALAGLGGEVARQLATAGGAVCYAVSVIIAQRTPPAPLVGRATLVLVFSVVQTVPLALYLADWSLPEITFESFWPGLYLGLFPTALATLVLYKLINEREPSFVAFQNYLVPVMGVFWGALLLDEAVTVQAVSALGLILFGIYLANRRSRAA